MIATIDKQIIQTNEKEQEILTFLTNKYWNNDIWSIKNSFFDDLRPNEKMIKKGEKTNIKFTYFSDSIKSEIKYMFAQKLINQEISLGTIRSYSGKFKSYAEFLNKFYPKINSVIELQWDRFISQWKLFLVNKGFKINDKAQFSDSKHMSFVNALHSFFIDFYDMRNEYEKDVWDCRNIPSFNKLTNTASSYKLNFSSIALVFRNLAKRYVSFKMTNLSQATCQSIIASLRTFFNYINEKEPKWNDLTKLTRKHMEDYICFVHEYSEGTTTVAQRNLIQLKAFLEYIERSECDEAPEKPSSHLIFKEDIPKRVVRNYENMKHIPEDVLRQLDKDLENLYPPEYIPVVILLRASGWRISDIFNLRYDTCLEKTTQGWYLCGDIEKTQVLNHRVPITDEIQHVVSIVIEETKSKSTDDNNPNHLLFVRYSGTRKGLCPTSGAINRALNKLAEVYNITDNKGNTFHFNNHAFRHTKGVSLVNNGMDLQLVQKWFAHKSSASTLFYAKILDEKLREEWKEKCKDGLFKIDKLGKMKKIEISKIENEDLIEWEYIRHNLDAVRTPLGYCMKPSSQECCTQMNPCLTCRNLCTTPDFIPAYEHEIEELKVLIERAEKLGQEIWAEKNKDIKHHYEDILAILKNGKIRHKAGKKGREYTGEERENQ
ncbi:tyrosine-type recombinase/integrase [Acetobacterium wieringae]|uniref:tyrosine-type recombinase/integrase n=1 Tax=Acetobacterium wieringae TaxID=52694 RepID=UPI0020342EC1|nr:tyrosine-type recombinase/integrase [Acetobacterium wieringae]URN84968.1 tyrosine-type recombinase/integrase [Acetobacterium wieringae]